MFKIIACINKKRAIGKDGELLYRIKNDLANFKTMTTSNVVIMGRKTFESLPDQKPLPDRINILMTENKDYCVNECFDNLYIVHSIADVFNLCNAFFSDKELFVIGGASIYKQFLDSGLVNEVLLTTVSDDKEGDAYFPELDENEWRTYYKSLSQRDSGKSFVFEILKRK